MALRNLMQALAMAVGGLAIVWLGLGIAITLVLYVGEFMSGGPLGTWTDPGAAFLWKFAMPAALGGVLAYTVASVGLRR